MGELMVWLIIGALLYMVITALLPILVIGAVILVALVLLRLIYDTYSSRKTAIRRNNQALIDRADHQHRLIMAGDDIGGVYGEYLPPRGLR